jgi:hypothetical protein
MDEVRDGLIHPVQILKDALAAWQKNFLAVFALYCTYIFFGKIFRLALPMCSFFPSRMPTDFLGWLGVGLTLFFVLCALALFFINALFVLMILHYVNPRNAGRVSFSGAFDDASQQVFRYLKTLLLFLVCIGVLFSIGMSAILLGNVLTFGKTSLEKIAPLLATSTVAVIFLIGAAWYGFSFSLGPLVAAFEKKGAWQSLTESRRRVRGHALRYLCSLAALVVFYMALGVGAYMLVKHLAHQLAYRRLILRAIDPIMAAAFGPLFLSVWLGNYLRLSELKNTKE